MLAVRRAFRGACAPSVSTAPRCTPASGRTAAGISSDIHATAQAFSVVAARRRTQPVGASERDGWRTKQGSTLSR